MFAGRHLLRQKGESCLHGDVSPHRASMLRRKEPICPAAIPPFGKQLAEAANRFSRPANCLGIIPCGLTAQRRGYRPPVAHEVPRREVLPMHSYSDRPAANTPVWIIVGAIVGGIALCL